jgi:hypothetical protein
VCNFLQVVSFSDEQATSVMEANQLKKVDVRHLTIKVCEKMRLPKKVTTSKSKGRFQGKIRLVMAMVRLKYGRGRGGQQPEPDDPYKD